jgi:uncharacterized protein (DUF1778 family)
MRLTTFARRQGDRDQSVKFSRPERNFFVTNTVLPAVQALLEEVETIEGSVKATTEVLAELDW